MFVFLGVVGLCLADLGLLGLCLCLCLCYG